MARKLRFYHYWDIKSIIYTTLTLTFFIIFVEMILIYPKIIKYIKELSHDQTTTGQLISATPMQHFSHSPAGSKLKTGHFLVSFSYEVAGKKYNGKELILSSGNIKYQLSEILKSENKKVTIRYNRENPARGILSLE